MFTAVCVHFGWDKCRALIPSMGHHTWPHVTSLSLSFSQLRYDQRAMLDNDHFKDHFCWLFSVFFSLCFNKSTLNPVSTKHKHVHVTVSKAAVENGETDASTVISARKGEFETGFEKGGQTREHAMLAKTAGVKHLIVLINKMDDPTVNWSLDRYEECKEKLVPFLKKVGFNPKKDIHFMPCSGMTGANLQESSELCSWYTGLPFISHLDSLPNFNRSSDGPIRLPIVDKYKDMGTVVLGKLESGSIAKAQQLIMMPNRHTVEVLSLLSDDVETDYAGPGENLKLRLKGIEEEEILPGFILCNAENLCHSGRTFDAQIVIIEHKSIICPGYNAVLHIHTCIEEVQITALICLVDKKTGEKSKTRPRFVKQDQVCIARLRAAGTICLETFKDFPQMGRFTLRDEGKTIAIGKVLKLVPDKD
uniref:G1 to S phase transition 2 n=1 Tax=Sinocyclocheilus grahami TaxID=75366 RepID=A0A672JU87_SINGR